WVGDRCDALAPRHVGRVFQHPDRLGAQLGYQLVHVIDVDIHLKAWPVPQVKTVLLPWPVPGDHRQLRTASSQAHITRLTLSGQLEEACKTKAFPEPCRLTHVADVDHREGT